MYLRKWALFMHMLCRWRNNHDWFITNNYTNILCKSWRKNEPISRLRASWVNIARFGFKIWNWEHQLVIELGFGYEILRLEWIYNKWMYQGFFTRHKTHVYQFLFLEIELGISIQRHLYVHVFWHEIELQSDFEQFDWSHINLFQAW